MCDPATAAYVAVALAAGSAYVSYDQQNKNAKYQNDMTEYNNKLSALNAADNNNAISYNLQAEKEASTEQLLREDIEGRKAEARARVATGESGIAGQTVDSLMRELAGNQAMYADSVQMNLEQSYAESIGQRKAVWNQFQSEVGSRTKAVGGNAMALALQIGQGGLSAYNQYQEGKYREEMAKNGSRSRD